MSYSDVRHHYEDLPSLSDEIDAAVDRMTFDDLRAAVSAAWYRDMAIYRPLEAAARAEAAPGSSLAAALTLLDNYLPDPEERAKAFSAVENIDSIKKKADFCFKWIDSIQDLTRIETREQRRQFLLNQICFAACIEGLYFFSMPSLAKCWSAQCCRYWRMSRVEMPATPPDSTSSANCTSHSMASASMS